MDLSPRLRDELAETGARLHARYPAWLRPFLWRDVIGITLGRRIYLAPHVATLPPAQAERLIRHELAHVRQIQSLGLIRFLWQYGREYVRHRRAGMSSAAAYDAISFEEEARRAEGL